MAAAVVCGLLAIAAKWMTARSPTYVDGNGILHEPFAWIATGSLLTVAALAFAAIAAAIWVSRLLRG